VELAEMGQLLHRGGFFLVEQDKVKMDYQVLPMVIGHRL